ncbi:MAG: hypothetical protein HY689_05760 [Chloroflexi bacterium]|nr:hypothetical protein [Chloroflexota bacterium]
MTPQGSAALLLRVGIHHDSGLVHLGFDRIGVDVPPTAFLGLMESLLAFDFEVVQWVVAGRRPRGVVRPTDDFLVTWNVEAERVYWEVSGFGFFLEPQVWGDVLVWLQRLHQATRAWLQEGTPMPQELVLRHGEPLLLGDEAQAVVEAVRWLRLPPQERRE